MDWGSDWCCNWIGDGACGGEEGRGGERSEGRGGEGKGVRGGFKEGTDNGDSRRHSSSLENVDQQTSVSPSFQILYSRSDSL